MKHILVALGVMLLCQACINEQQEVNTAKEDPVAGQAPAAAKQEEIARAKTVIKAFASELKAELTGAMQVGGPVAAIGVCNIKAMPIASRLAEEHGLQLGRVSLKYRNPANAPNDWQRVVLQDFEQRKLAGEDPAGISWAKIVDAGGQQEFRMMKAIPTGALCLQCHGAQIAPEVSEVLAGLYPEDLATGFQEGDLRGAFVVTRLTRDGL